MRLANSEFIQLSKYIITESTNTDFSMLTNSNILCSGFLLEIKITTQ
jgi:hypothetical protein